MAFDSVDVEAEPEARAELARRGIPGVPAVVTAAGAVHGWNPSAVAELVGVRYEGAERLSPRALADRLHAARFVVEAVEEKPITRRPPPPFITSTLQQEANRKLGWSARETMRVAQSLYERGLITEDEPANRQLRVEALAILWRESPVAVNPELDSQSRRANQASEAAKRRLELAIPDERGDLQTQWERLRFG